MSEKDSSQVASSDQLRKELKDLVVKKQVEEVQLMQLERRIK